MSDDSMTPREALVWRLARYLSQGRSKQGLRELLHTNLPAADDYEVEVLIEDADELAESEDRMAVDRLLSEVEG